MRTLSRIADELAKTAPVLVSFLHIFNRLASGEDMPPRRPLRRLRRKLSTTALTWMFVGIWGCVTAGMLAFALVMTYTGPTGGAAEHLHGIVDPAVRLQRQPVEGPRALAS